MSTKQQRDDMDDFFATRSYDSYGSWRDEPRTAEDPDDSASPPTADRRPLGAKPVAPLTYVPPAVRRGR